MIPLQPVQTNAACRCRHASHVWSKFHQLKPKISFHCMMIQLYKVMQLHRIQAWNFKLHWLQRLAIVIYIPFNISKVWISSCRIQTFSISASVESCIWSTKENVPITQRSVECWLLWVVLLLIRATENKLKAIFSI